MTEKTTNKEPINDNAEPPANAITLSDMAAAMQIDEDTLLQRFAAILAKRTCR